MIYPLAGLVIGAIFGGIRAKLKGGNRLDMLQWGGVCAIIFGVIGLFMLVFIERGAV